MFLVFLIRWIPKIIKEIREIVNNTVNIPMMIFAKDDFFIVNYSDSFLRVLADGKQIIQAVLLPLLVSDRHMQ